MRARREKGDGSSRSGCIRIPKLSVGMYLRRYLGVKVNDLHFRFSFTPYCPLAKSPITVQYFLSSRLPWRADEVRSQCRLEQDVPRRHSKRPPGQVGQPDQRGRAVVQVRSY